MSKSAKFNPRRHGRLYRARRRAVDIVFEAEMRDIDPVAIVEDRIALSADQNNQIAPVANYTRTLVTGVAEELDTIDDAIIRHLSESWTINRLPAVDRAVLRVCAWEILFNDDVDGPISVVEGVEIASQYSTDVAAPYIHAVLDDIVQSIHPDNPLRIDPVPNDALATGDSDVDAGISDEVPETSESPESGER